MDWQAIDWTALERLRAAFLEGSAGESDYWQSERDLASYDQTFAQRIGWKWDYVLRELGGRGWAPPPGDLLDWGCGSGVAGRAFLDHFGKGTEASLKVWDRSPLAVRYAIRRAEARFPHLKIEAAQTDDSPAAVLLLSHVLTELDDVALDGLLTMAGAAQVVVWVEPGTHVASRRLIQVRERMRAAFRIVAPCVHQARCGLLAPENAPHWCHHFAPPPPAVFTDSHWARFATLAGVDLRSLPLSFLVLDKRPLPELPEGAVRIVGAPRVYKAYALLLGCDAAGVCERRLTKRVLPEEFRRLKKEEVDPVQVWECDGSEIRQVHRCLNERRPPV